MEKIKIVNMAKAKEKWLSLMMHLNNSIPQVFKIECADGGSANKCYQMMTNVVKKHPTWFDMVVTRRGSDVFVVKTNFAQRVVIRDE